MKKQLIAVGVGTFLLMGGVAFAGQHGDVEFHHPKKSCTPTPTPVVTDTPEATPSPSPSESPVIPAPVVNVPPPIVHVTLPDVGGTGRLHP